MTRRLRYKCLAATRGYGHPCMRPVHNREDCCWQHGGPGAAES